MSLTASERQQLETLEENIRALAQLISGGGSKNQLNRLLVLAQNQNKKLTDRLEILETQVATILELIRKLQ